MVGRIRHHMLRPPPMPTWPRQYRSVMTHNRKARREIARQQTKQRPACPESSRSAGWRWIYNGRALLIYWLALTTATHWPAKMSLPAVSSWIGTDNILHAIMYAPLALLLIMFLSNRPAGSFWQRHDLLLSTAVLFSWAAIDEWTQPPFGRSASVADWIGDAIGVVLAGAGVWAVRAVRKLRADPA